MSTRLATTRFPTAAELNLWDVHVPEDETLQVDPCAIEHIQDPTWWDQGGRDPLDQRFIFRIGPGRERMERLRRIVRDFPRYGPKMYEKCARADRPDIMRELLALGAIVDIDIVKNQPCGSRDDDPTTIMSPAIIEAAFQGHLECVKVLVDEAGVAINFRHTDMTTALTNATVRGHMDIVEWLLQRGGLFTLVDRAISDLQYAVKSGNRRLAQLLLNSEQVINHNCRIQTSYIVDGAWSGNLQMVELVLEQAGFPSIPPPPDTGSSPTISLPILSNEQRIALLQALPWAIKKGTIDMVKLLLSYLTPRSADGSFKYVELSKDNHGTIFNATEDAMNGPRDDADLFELVWDTLLYPKSRSLAAHRQELEDLRDEYLHRRLISAATRGCPKITRLICEKYGADVNHVSHKFFTTPLSRAASSTDYPLPGRLAVARYLLKQPTIDIHIGTGEYFNGPTALALAVVLDKDDDDMIKLILEHGGPLEEIDPAVTSSLSQAEQDELITMWLVVEKDNMRYLVRLLTQESFEWHVMYRPPHSQKRLDFDKAGLERLISNLEVRKCIAFLAASDPKSRLFAM